MKIRVDYQLHEFNAISELHQVMQKVKSPYMLDHDPEDFPGTVIGPASLIERLAIAQEAIEPFTAMSRYRPWHSNNLFVALALEVNPNHVMYYAYIDTGNVSLQETVLRTVEGGKYKCFVYPAYVCDCNGKITDSRLCNIDKKNDTNIYLYDIQAMIPLAKVLNMTSSNYWPGLTITTEVYENMV